MQQKIDIPFRWGRTVITQNAQNTISETDIMAAFRRHIKCDWGELSDDDWELNNSAVLNGAARILSVYRDSNDKKFWIITDADRSVTTVLLTSDY